MGVNDIFIYFRQNRFAETINRYKELTAMMNKSVVTGRRRSYSVSTMRPDRCASSGERMCEDGSCIARVELCPEEQLMNQNTILIMIVVGLAVVVFLVILYCFQQRQRRANQEMGTDTGLTDECDNASLYAPPPAYEEVINSNLYPPTPEQRRLHQVSVDEQMSPMTPPPNYDAALVILAMSQDSVLSKPRRQSSMYRRSVSVENVTSVQNRRSSSPGEQNCDSPRKQSIKSRNIFRFSRHLRRTSTSSNGNNYNANSPRQSPRLIPSAAPPYPSTPPIIPLTPPPPFTPSMTSQQEQNSSPPPTSDQEVIS